MDRKLRRTALIIVLLLAVAGGAKSAAQAPSTAPTRILFVGNSYTYFNNLPAVLARLANSRQPGSVETEMVVIGGATLKDLWEKGDALKAIRQGHWTYVVLQEQSTLGQVPGGLAGINDPATFYEYARRFDAEIRKAGAKTAFYMTWARQTAPQNQAKLTAAYTSIARELGATLVPVGEAWQAALRQDPSLALHQADHSHPTPAGTYLAACVFYATLVGRNPEGLPAQVVGRPVDIDGHVFDNGGAEGVHSSPPLADLIDLPANEAKMLQGVAWKVAAVAPQQAGAAR